MVQGNRYFSLKFIMWFCNNAELRNKWSFSSVSLIFVIFTFVTCYMLIYICCLSSVWPIFPPPRGKETAWACTAPLCAGPSVLRNLTPCLVGINLQILFERGFGLTVSSFPASKNYIVEKSWTRSTLCCPCLTPICLAHKDDQPLAVGNRCPDLIRNCLHAFAASPKSVIPVDLIFFFLTDCENYFPNTGLDRHTLLLTCEILKSVGILPPAPSRNRRKWKTRSGNSRGTTEVCTASKRLIWDTRVHIWGNVRLLWSSLCVGICKWAWQVTGAQEIPCVSVRGLLQFCPLTPSRYSSWKITVDWRWNTWIPLIPFSLSIAGISREHGLSGRRALF